MGSVNLYIAFQWGDGRCFEYILVFLGALMIKSSARSHVPADVRNLQRDH